jgi:hypothetical protein
VPLCLRVLFYLERSQKSLRFSECNFNELLQITQQYFIKAYASDIFSSTAFFSSSLKYFL